MKYLNILILFMMISVTGFAQDEVSPEYRIVDKSNVTPNENVNDQFQHKVLIPAERGRYTDGQTLAPLHKFGYVFRNNAEASFYFDRFNANRNAQKVLNIGLSVIFGYFIIGTSISRPDLTLGFVGIGGAIISIANLAIGPIKKSNKRKLLSYSVDGIYSKAPETGPRLNLAMTSHGMGLVLNF